MSKEQLYPKDFYMSPNFVIHRLQRLFEKHGLKRLLVGNKFRSEREGWITAVFLLGLMGIQDKEYWVGLNSDGSTPDTYGVTFRKLNNGQSRDILNIEIFEWEKHSNLSIEEAILKKLSNKCYPQYFILLCYIHSRPGEKVEFEKIFRKFEGKKINIGEIWALANMSDYLALHVVTKIYPNRCQITFSYLDEMKKHNDQKEMIKVSKGLGTDFTDLGTKHLPLPE